MNKNGASVKGGYEETNKDTYKEKIGAIEGSYSKEDKNRSEGGLGVTHKKGETKVNGEGSYTQGQTHTVKVGDAKVNVGK